MPGTTPLPAAGHHTARLNDAMWNYLSLPFLLIYPGVRAHEISPREEDGKTWGRPRVTFPAITTHAAGQVFYFGDGPLRCLDYTAGASGGVPAAHYTGAYQTFGRLAFPHSPPGLPPQLRRHARPQPGRHHARHLRHHRQPGVNDGRHPL